MTVTRFAPSPTGYLHIGNLRAALFNWLIARKAGGTFILRLDDTDPERTKEEYVDAIKADMEWLGLSWDRVERQSERLDRYSIAAGALKAKGRLYEAFETRDELEIRRKKQLATGRPPVYDRSALGLTEEARTALRLTRQGHWRFRLDQERIVWADGILGEVSIDAASVSDPVLIRGDGQVLYTLASAVDDTDMGVTDVVRGADHVTNTATQIQLIQSLKGQVPGFSHHSLLTGPQGEALSKRLGTLALRDLRAQGVEPLAVLSLMARLGSADPVALRADMAELIEGFDIARFGAAPTKFDEGDLFRLTARHLASLPHAGVAADLRRLGVPDDIAPHFWVVVRENVATRAEIGDWWAICQGAARPEIAEEDQAFVREAMALLPPPPYGPDSWSSWTEEVKAQSGRKGRTLYAPLRLALTGRSRGPEMADLLPLMQAPPRL